MTWTAPRTWVTGEIVTASHMNTDVRDNAGELMSTVQGDDGATLEHRHLTGAFASRPAAGNPGRFYTCTDFAVTFYDDGSDWSVFSHNTRYVDRLRQDFHEPGGPILMAAGYIFGWYFFEGTSASGGVGTDHSMMVMNALTSTGAHARFTPQGGAYIVSNGGSCYPMVCEMSVRLVDNSNVTYHFGLANGFDTSQNPQPASSIMLAYGRSGDADLLQYWTVTQHNSGGETKNDSGVTPTHTNMDVLRIEVVSSSLARFYINGTKTGTDHTTGIPTTQALQPGFVVRTNANDNKVLQVDHIDLLYARNLP